MNRKKISCIYLILVFSILPSQFVFGQVRAGLGFLKIPPGSSVQTIGGGFSALFDGTTAQFANPGMIGFFPQWQISANYARWIADVNQASLTYGFGLRTPWSRRSKFALALLYQGVPNFDSSNLNAPAASANEFIAAFGLGQPLSIFSRNIAFGTNIKYFKSELGEYTANSLIFDFGVVGHSPKYRLGLPLFEYGYLSAGISMTQLGNSISYDRVGTPLPLTMRTGLAVYLGSHHGIKFQLMTDFYRIKDEDDAISVGTEISFHNLLALNLGYNSRDDLFSHFFVGAKINLNDYQFSGVQMLPGRNQALEFDMATLHEGEFFERTYHGGIHLGPNGPQKFDLLAPALNDTIRSRRAVLRWETTTDPNLYDDVKYTVIVDLDSVKIAQVIEEFENNHFTPWTVILPNLHFEKIETVAADSFELGELKGGQYYWAVFATDQDDHFVFAEKGNVPMSGFIVPVPDIKVKQIHFDYSPWITEDDYHGDLNILIENVGNVAANDFTLEVTDSLLNLVDFLPGFRRSQQHKKLLLSEEKIEKIEPGEVKIVKVPWRTTGLGKHKIQATALVYEQDSEEIIQSESLSAHFHTIPKGKFTCKDTSDVLRIAEVSIDMPIITEICFASGSAEIQSDYLNKSIYDPPITILTERLKANPGMKIQLQGFSDPNSGEKNVKLAEQRSAAVRQAMLQRGVNTEQIEIVPGEVLPRRRVPKNDLDAKWVFEERRFVKITTQKVNIPNLFKPVRHNDQQNATLPVRFENTIESVVELTAGTILCENKTMFDSVSVEDNRSYRNSRIQWVFDEAKAGDWVGKMAKFSFAVIDSLGRRFQTPGKMTYLRHNLEQKEHRLAFPLKFGETEPMYQFYWDRLFDQCREILDNPGMRFAFQGHACAVGPSDVNLRLSKRRAKRFERRFIKYIKRRHAEFYQKFVNRLDSAKGFGEAQPLKMQQMDETPVLVGDNNSPMGRKLNRRIEIYFYPKN